MNANYTALGLNLDGTALVLRPIVASGTNVIAHCIALSDLQKQGMTESRTLVGAMLITALSAYHPELDRYALLPETRPPLPFLLTLDNRAEMRSLRMGLGVSDTTIQTALVINAFAGDVPIGQDDLQSLKQLAELGKSVAPSFIGEIILRKLAAMHPDVLRPLFPTMAL
jgi:hypothetical protein